MPEYARMIRMLAECANSRYARSLLTGYVHKGQLVPGMQTETCRWNCLCPCNVLVWCNVAPPCTTPPRWCHLGLYWSTICFLENFNGTTYYGLHFCLSVSATFLNWGRHGSCRFDATWCDTRLRWALQRMGPVICTAQARFGCRGARLVACLNRQFADPTDGIYSCGKPEFAGVSQFILANPCRNIQMATVVSQKTNSCHREIYNLPWVLPLETFDVTEPEGNDIHSALSSKRWRRWEF